MMATKSSPLAATSTTIQAQNSNSIESQQQQQQQQQSHNLNHLNNQPNDELQHHHQLENLHIHLEQHLHSQHQLQQDHNNNINHLQTNSPFINQFFSNSGSITSTGQLINTVGCVSGDDVPNNNIILTDMIKIEDDYYHNYQHQPQQQLPQSHEASTLQHNSITNHNHQHYLHHQQHSNSLVSQHFYPKHSNPDIASDSSPNLSSPSSSTSSSSSSSTSAIICRQQKSDHLNLNLVQNKSPGNSQQQQSTLPSSPAMLMNHLDLSSMCSSPSASSSSLASGTTATTSNENAKTTNSTAEVSTLSASSTTTTTNAHYITNNDNVSSLQHLATTMLVNDSAANNRLTHQQQIRNFDTNKIYYGENSITANDESSCQSLSNLPDSSSIIPNTKSLSLQPNSIIAATGSNVAKETSVSNESSSTGTNSSSLVIDEKLVKRIRFKGSLANDEQQEKEIEQNPMNDNASLLDQQNQNQSSNDHTDLLDQNPFAYRSDQENIYSSRNNVANCYDYAWRRWSKTDAPSVKNQAAGTVQVPHTMPKIEDEENRKFQYILGAPTSAGTRVGLMTMTYLNQGQSYEIRLKKKKKIPQEPNLKTMVRLGFVEKRLQYRENEELNAWVQTHNNARMIDIDFSMSYGVFDIDLRSQFNHSITFVWNPGREASIFIKINCISTEFTSKRHGGERGTPFRLIVDTYSVEGSKIDSACCLIKVFKSKGAERKHKTDRDRVAKHPDSENYYQPSYDCTLLTTFKDEEIIASNQQQNNSELSQHHHQSEFDHNDSISTLTNRSMTESPTCSELSIITTATTPNTPISPHNLVSHSSHHHHHQSSLILDHSSSFSSISNNSNIHQTSPISSSPSNLSTKIDAYDHSYHHHHLMSSSKSSEQISPLAGPSSLAMVASCQQGGPGEFSMSTATLTISSPIMANSNSQSQSSNCSKYVEKFDEPGIVRTSSLSLSIRSISPSITSMMKNFGSSSSLNGLPFDANAYETNEWLKRNRFFRFAEQLADYSAEDLRRLTRDDLIQLCDFKDGIRLYNLIHTPEVSTTKLTLFITFDGNEHYALYFKYLTVEELRDKLSECMYNNNIVDYSINDLQHSMNVRLRNIHLTGPNNIRVKLTNEVLQNMKNESIYRCFLTKVDNEYDVVIGSIQNQNQNNQLQQ